MVGESSDHLLQRIKGYLQATGAQPGDRIPGENELSETLGASRPAVREALVALEAVGLLASRKGSRRVVQSVDFGTVLRQLADFVDIDKRRMLDLLFIRQILEVQTLPVAVPKLSSEAMERLGAVTRTIEEKAARGEHFSADDREFHLLLYSGLGNEVLDGLLGMFWASYDRIDPAKMVHSQRIEETAAHHRRIFDALAEGDIRKAQHHLDKHFYDTAYAIMHQGDGEPDGLS
jgi:GntR family transcriptional regulator, transcriptional repressor for pyruvate dehydrogenase complex